MIERAQVCRSARPATVGWRYRVVVQCCGGRSIGGLRRSRPTRPPSWCSSIPFRSSLMLLLVAALKSASWMRTGGDDRAATRYPLSGIGTTGGRTDVARIRRPSRSAPKRPEGAAEVVPVGVHTRPTERTRPAPRGCSHQLGDGLVQLGDGSGSCRYLIDTVAALTYGAADGDVLGAAV